MTWSPDYKKNRFYVVNHMKIKDYQNYDSLREYYGVLNGQNPNRELSPRAPTFSGLGNPTKILDNIKRVQPRTPVPSAMRAPAMKPRELRFEPRAHLPGHYLEAVGLSANLHGKSYYAQNFTRAFASSYTIPAAK